MSLIFGISGSFRGPIKLHHMEGQYGDVAG
jgi:hypothetical protein